MLDFSNPFAPFSQSRVSNNNKECSSLKQNGSGFIQGAPNSFLILMMVQYLNRLLPRTDYYPQNGKGPPCCIAKGVQALLVISLDFES